MCLAVPGRLINIDDADPTLPMGTVDFGGVRKDIQLAFVPEARVGDHVLVHVGFAIQVVDDVEAARILQALESLEEPNPEFETR